MLDLLLKIAGKSDFKIDESVSSLYLLRVCVKYASMMIRGFFNSLFYKNWSKKIFIGKHVRLLEKKSIIIKDNVKIHDNVRIDALSKEGVIIGKNVVIGHDTIIECTGSIKNVGKGLKIGEASTFGNDCFFGAAGGIVIGENVVAGQYIRFHSENHNYHDLNILIKNQGVTNQGIIVGNNCWIGSGVVFLDGSSLGDGCVVAANSVVTKEFGNNCVIGGVPAKILKERGE